MRDAQLHMPPPIAKVVSERHGYFRRAHDPDFGVCWLIRSVEAVSLEERNWRAGSEWFGEIAPSLVEWVCAFAPSGHATIPAFIQARDDDFKANDRELLAFKRRLLQMNSESPAEVTVKYISQNHKNVPANVRGWIPRYLPHDAVEMDVSAHHRQVFGTLDANFETFRQAAETLASQAKQSDQSLQITELLLPSGSDVLAVGHHGDGYARFFVGKDLTPSINDLD